MSRDLAGPERLLCAFRPKGRSWQLCKSCHNGQELTFDDVAKSGLSTKAATPSLSHGEPAQVRIEHRLQAVVITRYRAARLSLLEVNFT